MAVGSAGSTGSSNNGGGGGAVIIFEPRVCDVELEISNQIYPRLPVHRQLDSGQRRTTCGQKRRIARVVSPQQSRHGHAPDENDSARSDGARHAFEFRVGFSSPSA